MVYQTRSDRMKLAREHVDEIRSKLKCSSCGLAHWVATIEFHSEDHIKHPDRRISRMVHLGASIEEIDLEISKCEALCKRCHLTLDGRLQILQKSKRHRTPIGRCGFCNILEKPLRRRLCNSCYNFEYRNGWPKSLILGKCGHYKLGSNVYVDSKGGRACLQCRRENSRKAHYRKRETKP